MNLFGIEITFASKKQDDAVRKSEENDLIRRHECHKAMDMLNQRFADLKEHIDTRFEDIKDLLLKRR